MYFQCLSALVVNVSRLYARYFVCCFTPIYVVFTLHLSGVFFFCVHIMCSWCCCCIQVRSCCGRCCCCCCLLPVHIKVDFFVVLVLLVFAFVINVRNVCCCCCSLLFFQECLEFQPHSQLHTYNYTLSHSRFRHLPFRLFVKLIVSLAHSLTNPPNNCLYSHTTNTCVVQSQMYSLNFCNLFSVFFFFFFAYLLYCRLCR